MDNRELIQNLANALTVEVEKLERRIKELEYENTQYKEALGIMNTVQDLEERTPLSIKPEYVFLSRHQHTIFEDWLENPLSEEMLTAYGYKCFYPLCIYKAGTTKAWTHESILEDSLIYQQSPDHFHSVLQIAAYLIKFGFTNVTIHHWNDVDVTGSFRGKTYAFEYERPGTHSIKALKTKFNVAKLKYDFVYFVCQTSNKATIAKAIEPTGEIKFNCIPHNMCTRGKQFKYFIERIISGHSIQNCPIKDNL